MSSRIFSCAGLAVALLLGGCVDPEGDFNDFAERVGTESSAVGGCEGGAPPSPGEGGGDVLLAVSVVSPTLPILFAGTAETLEDTATGRVKFNFDLQPLDAADRTTRIGDIISEEFVLGEDGVLTAEIPRRFVDARANPITFTQIDAQVTLRGAVCHTAEPWSTGPVTEANLYCGKVSGNVYAPITAELAGDFALIRLASPTSIPDPPPYSCDPTKVADPAPTPP